MYGALALAKIPHLEEEIRQLKQEVKKLKEQVEKFKPFYDAYYK